MQFHNVKSTARCYYVTRRLHRRGNGHICKGDRVTCQHSFPRSYNVCYTYSSVISLTRQNISSIQFLTDFFNDPTCIAALTMASTDFFVTAMSDIEELAWLFAGIQFAWLARAVVNPGSAWIGSGTLTVAVILITAGCVGEFGVGWHRHGLEVVIVPVANKAVSAGITRGQDWKRKVMENVRISIRMFVNIGIFTNFTLSLLFFLLRRVYTVARGRRLCFACLLSWSLL